MLADCAALKKSAVPHLSVSGLRARKGSWRCHMGREHTPVAACCLLPSSNTPHALRVRLNRSVAAWQPQGYDDACEHGVNKMIK